MNKTADIYKLLQQDEKKQERPKMKNTTDLLKAYADAAIYSGVETQLGDKLGKEAAKALTDAIDQRMRATYVATQNLFGRTSALSNKTNHGPTPPKADNDNTPDSTPRMGR